MFINTYVAPTALAVTLITAIFHIKLSHATDNLTKQSSSNQANSSTSLYINDRDAIIAFHITVDKSQLPNLDRLIQRIHHPQNHYLIDYHHTISPSHYLSLDQFSNVHQRAADMSVPSGVSHVLNLLDGIAHFLNANECTPSLSQFDYYIPLTPHSYPTVTASRLRSILPTSQRLLPNFFHFAHKSQLPLFNHQVNHHFIDTCLSFNHSVEPSLLNTKKHHPDHHRRTYHLPRASLHFVVNRHFASQLVDSMLTKRLLVVLAETAFVSNRFFATFAHSADINLVGPTVHTTDLHCIDSEALDSKVLQVLPDYTPRIPSVPFLKQAGSPCLFTAPFDSPDSLAVRNVIDKDLLIAPGANGKPPGVAYHDVVAESLNRILRSIS